MAVMREDREELASALREIFWGPTAQHDFDDSYYERWCESGDAAVAEIATFGWTRNRPDVLLPYRPGRRCAVQIERDMASRAVLFLKSDLEYEWPTNVGAIPYFCLWGPGCYLALGWSLIFIAAFSTGATAAVWGAVGVLALIPTLHWYATRQRRAANWRAFHRSGDISVWPFKNQHDFNAWRVR